LKLSAVGQLQPPLDAPEAILARVDSYTLARIACILIGQVAVNAREAGLDEAQAMPNVLLAAAQLGQVALNPS
jgi:hypothetical protein